MVPKATIVAATRIVTPEQAEALHCGRAGRRGRARPRAHRRSRLAAQGGSGRGRHHPALHRLQSLLGRPARRQRRADLRAQSGGRARDRACGAQARAGAGDRSGARRRPGRHGGGARRRRARPPRGAVREGARARRQDSRTAPPSAAMPNTSTSRAISSARCATPTPLCCAWARRPRPTPWLRCRRRRWWWRPARRPWRPRCPATARCRLPCRSTRCRPRSPAGTWCCSTRTATGGARRRRKRSSTAAGGSPS